jgi:hypothetical protein
MSHGGAREGSGRKRKFGELQREPTRPVHVPSDIPADLYNRATELALIKGYDWLERYIELGFKPDVTN